MKLYKLRWLIYFFLYKLNRWLGGKTKWEYSDERYYFCIPLERMKEWIVWFFIWHFNIKPKSKRRMKKLYKNIQDGRDVLGWLWIGAEATSIVVDYLHDLFDDTILFHYYSIRKYCEKLEQKWIKKREKRPFSKKGEQNLRYLSGYCEMIRKWKEKQKKENN